MKKLILLSAMLSAVLTTDAQQALWGGSQIVSPQTNDDNTVTFRLFAPNASKVEITGDFLPPVTVDTPYGPQQSPGTAPLSKTDDGLWQYTSSSLSPELYSYSFIVDGMRVNDPSNVYLLRDIATLTNVFLIPGAQADYYKVSDVPHGSVSKVWYPSETLGMDRRMTVDTPADYEKGDRDYPVFYLLHGSGGDENAWPELGRATQILDNMIASGKVEPMIVVMTNGNAALQAAPGESSAGFVPPTTNLPKMMDGSFEMHFPEVVKYIDSHYRTIPDKAHRAIGGLSMGGFHSMHISKQFPDMFDYVGLFSAAVNPRNGMVSEVYSDLDAKLKTQFEAKPALYWIAIGNKDFLYEENRDYRKYLDQHNFPYTYRESEDGHIWKNWRIYLTEFLPLLFR